MVAVAGGGWGAHGSDDFTMYRVFKFTRLPISLPGKEMDLAEADRPSVRGEQFPTTMFLSISRPSTPSWHWTEWNGVVHL